VQSNQSNQSINHKPVQVSVDIVKVVAKAAVLAGNAHVVLRSQNKTKQNKTAMSNKDRVNLGMVKEKEKKRHHSFIPCITHGVDTSSGDRLNLSKVAEAVSSGARGGAVLALLDVADARGNGGLHAIVNSLANDRGSSGAVVAHLSVVLVLHFGIGQAVANAEANEGNVGSSLLVTNIHTVAVIMIKIIMIAPKYK
jgi:hypothetical protein